MARSLLSGLLRVGVLEIIDRRLAMDRPSVRREPFGHAREMRPPQIRSNPLTSLNAFNLWVSSRSWVHKFGYNTYRVAGHTGLRHQLILSLAGVRGRHRPSMRTLRRRGARSTTRSSSSVQPPEPSGSRSSRAYMSATCSSPSFAFAPFVVRRGFRWLFAVGSFLLFLNLYFPYAYYANRVGIHVR